MPPAPGCAPTIASRSRGIGGQFQHGPGPGGGIPGRQQHRRLARDFGHGTAARGNRRRAELHPLQHRQPETLEQRGVEVGVAVAVQPDQLGVRDVAGDDHVARDAELVQETREILHVPALPAREHQRHRFAAARQVPREGLRQPALVLARLDGAHAQPEAPRRHVASSRRAARPACRRRRRSANTGGSRAHARPGSAERSAGNRDARLPRSPRPSRRRWRSGTRPRSSRCGWPRWSTRDRPGTRDRRACTRAAIRRAAAGTRNCWRARYRACPARPPARARSRTRPRSRASGGAVRMRRSHPGRDCATASADRSRSHRIRDRARSGARARS